MTSAGRTSRLAVFAVEDTAAQLTWSSLATGRHVLRAGPATVEVEGGGPGAADLTGLEPDTQYEVTLDGEAVARFRTLARAPGEELCRFATVNDNHVGQRSFGPTRRIAERDADVPFPERCLRGALDDARDWGATHVVAKGDLTQRNRPHELKRAGEILRACGLDVSAVLGNHDVTRRGVPAQPALAAHGVRVPPPAYAVDLPGVRLVHLASARRGHSRGWIDAEEREAVADLASEATTPVFVVLHHPLQRLPFPVAWPPGVFSPDARAFLNALVAANPNTLVASGHSHRNRRRTHGPVVIVQTGSTKDFPGGWAGYAVHEGGIRQVFRRTPAPDVLEWTERTRRALLGAWPLWSIGRLSWRCFTHAWPDPARLR